MPIHLQRGDEITAFGVPCGESLSSLHGHAMRDACTRLFPFHVAGTGEWVGMMKDGCVGKSG